MATQIMTIQVDAVAAELIGRAEAVASANGETLGSYLRHALPTEIVNGNEKKHASQAVAWNSFVSRMTALVEGSVPLGHVADDSRDSIYDDRA